MRKDISSAPADVLELPKTSMFAETWRRFRQNKLAMIGLVIIFIIAFGAAFADLLVDYDVAITIDVANARQLPSTKHILGTDELGRDLLARIVHGSRTSILVSVVAVTFSLIVGGIAGAVAGYYGGVVETVIMRISDILQAIPNLLLAIAILSAFGQSMTVLIIAVGISNIPAYARIIRASTLTIKGQEYIEAAKAVGASDAHIILKHVINNCVAPIIVQATLSMANAILNTSSMCFLGLGVKAPTPEWGAIMAGGRAFLREAWHITLFPGVVIMLTVLALNLMGDGLRDALDPKLKK